MALFLKEATLEDKQIIDNLNQYYTYDMSKPCGWKIPACGRFDVLDLGWYWTEPNRHPFLIMLDKELVGFVLINKVGTCKAVDWNVGEFFVLGKFQGKGIGKEIAFQIFNKFKGIWEVAQMPDNLPAIAFWNKVIKNYTDDHFESFKTIIDGPKPYPMNILRFRSR
ncbi:MAG: GNAT family N-acetyltransferase [Parachlamydiales bacterium]|nr:GNAT family N-acetyltransferase [Parachlamydiales bacterium]